MQTISHSALYQPPEGDDSMASQIADEHSEEREQLALAQECHTPQELAAELGALATLLKEHFAEREGAGGLLEHAVESLPVDDARPGHVLAAQREIWAVVHRELTAVEQEAAAPRVEQRLQHRHAAGLHDIAWRLRSLHEEEQALLADTIGLLPVGADEEIEATELPD